MSNRNVEPDIHTVRVNMSKGRRHTFGPVQEASTSVSRSSNYTDYPRSGRGTPKLSTKSDFVYVNSAYVGSVNSVNNIDRPRFLEPPTSVIREQYWACSKWSLAQRVLAIAVGVLLGAVIGLVITIFIRGDAKDDITNFSAIASHLFKAQN